MSGMVERKVSRRRLAGGLLGLAMGLMVLSPAATAAQGGADGPGIGEKEIAQGITVHGDGEAEAPADSAVMQFIVRVDPSAEGDPTKSGPGFPSNVSDDQMTVLVAAAQSKGIDGKSVAYMVVSESSFSSSFGPGVGVLAVQIDKAELKHRVKIADAVTRAARDNGLVFDQIGIHYIVDDCVALDMEALADAAESAEAQATRMAQAIGLTLGELIAVEKQANYTSYSGLNRDVCAEIPTLETAMEQYFPAFDRNGDAEREIYESIDVVYAIG